jgi:hypothetical protein
MMLFLFFTWFVSCFCFVHFRHLTFRSSKSNLRSIVDRAAEVFQDPNEGGENKSSHSGHDERSNEKEAKEAKETKGNRSNRLSTVLPGTIISQIPAPSMR